MDLQGAQAELIKIKANLAKDPSVTTDKTKADLMKKLDGVLNGLKPLIEKQKKIKSTLAGIPTLNADIAAFNTAMAKVSNEARVANKDAAVQAKRDTPKRDYIMMANYLQVVGQEESIEKL